jgi:hypothetical protein
VKKKKTKLQVPPRAQIGIAVGVPLLILLVGWFMVVGGQRSKASELANEAQSLQIQIATARAALATTPKAEPIRVADIFRLTKAMPDQEDMPGIILQLNAVAAQAGISFTSITPGPATPATGYGVRQIALTFDGNFYGLSDFLYRLRNLVGVHGGELTASGRLFSVEQLSFNEAEDGFPAITAKLTLDAYVYGTAVTPGAVPAPVAPTGTDGSTTTSTTTATTTTTGSTPSAAVAAPPSTGVTG